MTLTKSISIAQAAPTIAAAGAGVTQRCVSLATGTLSPDLRVNYEFGLVLGVDEFRQEQLYFLEKGYQHNRGLHGFGTVYGLQVTTAPPSGDTQDLHITVSPGMVIDQYGRALIVRNEQCARLAAWLAKQVQTDPNIITKQSTGLSGELSVYIVARYSECTDALVPIPGQPCSSAEQSMAPSRIRDSFSIELRWEPPAMPAWDAVRAFGGLIDLVRPVRDLPLDQSDEALLAQLVRKLNDPDGYAAELAVLTAGTPSDQPRDLFRLPAETAGAALDRLYTIWATEVRPHATLPPNLHSPQSPDEAAVLLARIDFLPDEPFDIQHPAISYALDEHGQPVQPDNQGRPFLLHTELIQELRGPGLMLEHREFATIAARDGQTLRVWVHHGELLDLPLPDALELTVDAGPVTIIAVDPVAPNVFDLQIEPAILDESPGGPPLPPGALIELRFRLLDITAHNQPLISDIDTFAIDYLGRDSDTIAVYTVVTAAVETAASLPVQEFVSIRTFVSDQRTLFRAWFHTDQPISLPQQVRVQRGFGRNASHHLFSTQPITTASSFSEVWTLVPPPNMRLADGELLSFSFDTSSIAAEGRGTLADVLAERQIQLLGYDGQTTIRAFHVISLPLPPVDGGLTEAQVNVLIEQAINNLPRPEAKPVLPFVTITPTISDSQVQLEVWFHPAVKPDDTTAEIDPKFAENRPFRVFAELGQQGGIADLTDAVSVFPMRSNIFMLEVDPEAWKGRSDSSRWLRVLFFVNDMQVNQNGSAIGLAEYIKSLPFVFEGAIDPSVIIAYVRVVQFGGM